MSEKMPTLENPLDNAKLILDQLKELQGPLANVWQGEMSSETRKILASYMERIGPYLKLLSDSLEKIKIVK
jgi:hypothetical protein